MNALTRWLTVKIRSAGGRASRRAVPSARTEPRPPNSRQQSFLYPLARTGALAAGLFVVLLTGLLLVTTVRGKVATLVNSKQVVRLHDELRTRPKDEALKQQIRQLDLQLRQETFSRLNLSHQAARALIGGLVIFLLCAHWTRQPVIPNPLAWGARRPEKSQLALYGVATVFGLAAFAAVLAARAPAQLPGGELVAEAPVDDAVFHQQWPAFRGPTGSGAAPDANIALPWRILWKTPVPLPGMSSPILWSNSVFLTGATATEDRVFRFDAATGALIWSATLASPKPPAPKTTEDTGLAAPTPVTDGRRVYAVFPDGLAAAFDLTGKPVWQRNLGPLENAYGYAASPALYRDRLLIQIDSGEPADGKSRLLALDSRTGRVLWQVNRPVAGSWTSPVLVEWNGQAQLLTCATPFVIAYNPLDGAELWRVAGLESDCAPAPILASNIVVAIAPNNAVLGVQPGTTNVVWRMTDGVPDAPSPVSDGQRIYVVDPNGTLSCLNQATGQAIWTHDFNDNFYASPTLAGTTLILLSRKGVAYLVATGDRYQELGRFELGEKCNASPAPRGQQLFVRCQQNLFCIESAAK